MLKLSILMVRRNNFTYERFLKYWREVHAPLFAAIYRIIERATCYRGQHPRSSTVSRRFGSMTLPGPKLSSGRTVTGRM